MASQDKTRKPIRIPLPVSEQGLGDVVHRVTKALRIPHCAPCAERKARFNRAVRFGRTSKVSEKT